LVERGEAIGFYEAHGLAEVFMYGDGREAWENWPRSLPMRDQYFGWRQAVGHIGLRQQAAAAEVFRQRIEASLDASRRHIRLDGSVG